MAHHDPGDQVAPSLPAGAGRALAVAVTVGGVALGCVLAGSVSRALIFALSLIGFLAPGFPIAALLFSGPERLLAGAAVGYLTSSLVASALYSLGILGGATLVGFPLGLAAGLGLVLRGRRAPPGAVEPTERGWLPLAFALAMAIVALPFVRVGAQTEDGTAYRAYFSADLMTHLSVTAELQKERFPPLNPFYSGEPLAYYWLFFLFPAQVGRWIGNQQSLLLTYLAGDLLFAGLAFCAARRLAGGPGSALVATAAGLAAGSYEGLAALLRAALLGLPLGSFREMNLDAFSRWVFELVSLDGLHRSLLYTPQHLFSYSLLLLLILIVLRNERRSGGELVLVGALLGGMAGTSIVTAMLAGLWLAMMSLGRAAGWRAALQRLSLVVAPALGCVAWFQYLGFFSEAGGALGLRRTQVWEIAGIGILEAGPLLLLAAASVRLPRARPLALLATLALAAVLSLDIRGYEGVWMAWRAGSVFLVALFLMAASGLGQWRRAAVAAILLPATLTTLLDLYNAQDVENRLESAGAFPWTTVVSHAEDEALAWIRTQTPPETVVQVDARARGAGQWALVPALGQRRTAVGFPIFLLELQKYRARERRLRPIFTSPDPALAHRLAVEAGIGYLFLGRAEISEPRNRARKFWEAPQLFQETFSNGQTSIFAVLQP